MSTKKFTYDFQALEYLNKLLITKGGYHVYSVERCCTCKHYVEERKIVPFAEITSYYCKRVKIKGPSGLTLVADVEPFGYCTYYKRRKVI